MFIACIVIGIVIILVETVLWFVFRHKVDGICFPSETDHSHFRFFTLVRMQLLAILHVVFLIGMLVIPAIYLW